MSKKNKTFSFLDPFYKSIRSKPAKITTEKQYAEYLVEGFLTSLTLYGLWYGPKGFDLPPNLYKAFAGYINSFSSSSPLTTTVKQNISTYLNNLFNFATTENEKLAELRNHGKELAEEVLMKYFIERLKKNPDLELDEAIVSFESGSGAIEDHAKLRTRTPYQYRQAYNLIFQRAKAKIAGKPWFTPKQIEEYAKGANRERKYTPDEIQEFIRTGSSSSLDKQVARSKEVCSELQILHVANKAKTGQEKKFAANRSLSERIADAFENAGSYRRVIDKMQKRYPTFKNKNLVWHNADSDGACFFTAAYAAANNLTKDPDLNKSLSTTHPAGADAIRNMILVTLEKSPLAADANVLGLMTQTLTEDKILQNNEYRDDSGVQSFYTNVETGEVINDNDVLKLYVEHMRNPKQWAGHLEMLVLSLAIEEAVVVIDISKPEHTTRIFYKGDGISEEAMPEKFIVLGRVNNNHYIYALQSN